MSETNYYIGTGAKNCYFTLRYWFTERVGEGVITRDYHVRNLSTEHHSAIAKARELTGLGLTADFEVLPFGRVDEIDWSVLRGGKYAGKSIHEIRESDPGYLLWLAEAGLKSYEKTVELIRALLAHELEARATERNAAAEAEIARAAAAAARFEPVAGVLAGLAGDFCKSIASDLRRGELPRGRALPIALDIYAKAHGRRNSKAYDAAYDVASELLADPAEVAAN